MTKKTFAALLSKEIGGGISEKERACLRQTLAEDRRLEGIYNEIHGFMRERDREPLAGADIEARLDEVWDKIAGMPAAGYHPPRPRKHIVPGWARITASIAILAGLSWMVYHYILPEREPYGLAIEAGRESLYTVLDDGTQVWLNKHSRIDYNDRFGLRDRKIRLTGEAFFDVARRPGVPLTVTARGIDVTVKGTAFNVDAASADIKVSLIRGLVAVKDNREKNAKEVLLRPNQKIVLRDAHLPAGDSSYVVSDLVREGGASIPETQWLKGPLVFRKQRFSDLSKLMEQRYRVTIEIKNDALPEQRFTGSINDETLQQMLDALKQSYPFDYQVEGERVVIR